MSVSGHYTFTYTCNSCGRKAQKHRVCDENAAVDSLRDPFSYPEGWQYRGGDGPLRHFCPECLVLDEQNARAPLAIRYAVMRWHKAFIAGNEDEAVARCDDVFSAAATLVLGEEGLKEAGKLHDAAIATSLDPFPVEAGFWYELRDGRISHCHHVADGIAHTALGHCNAEDGKSLSDSALDIVRKTKIRRRFFDHTIDDPEVLSLFRDKEG